MSNFSLRPSLDSVLYASTQLQLADLKQLKEMIIQMYGADYVTKAINNEDKIVNQDLISKLKETNITEATIKERLLKFTQEIQAKANKANSTKKEEDEMFGKTIGNTININQISSENIPLDLIAGLNIDDNDPFGGEAIKTINPSNADTLKTGDNQISEALGGETYETMNLLVANPNNKNNPYEESLDELIGPTIEQVYIGRTLDLELSLKLAKGKSIDL